uniref:Reverse transcriptase domain-containing protein n=1 Tax=Tanacetum cinerariifolium TaxID=118510 RepID=A0A699HWH4_TANCI|nr:hypothetical protein [Tanacetum cinerariifolium]
MIDGQGGQVGGQGSEATNDRNERDDNKRTRTGNAFATTINSVRRENMGHLANDCKVVPKNVNPVNARNPAAARVNLPNQALAIDMGQDRGNNGNQARGRAFMSGEEETRQNLNIMPGIEPNNLGFSYEIEIASGQLVEIDKKVVRIPLLDGNVLKVLGKRPEEKARHLMSAKAKEQKQEDMVAVRDFFEGFTAAPAVLKPERLKVDKTRLYKCILLFGDRRLERTATVSISMISE